MSNRKNIKRNSKNKSKSPALSHTNNNNNNDNNVNDNDSNVNPNTHWPHRRGSKSNNNQRNRPSKYHKNAPVPQSRTKRDRKKGILSKQIQQSLEDSTWNKVKREKLDTLKDDTPFSLNSFFSNCSCDQIFNELVLFFKGECNLDLTIHHNKYMMKGRKFINNIMCEFQIEMFRASSSHKEWPNHILVEFTKRNGDGFVFQKLLNQIFKGLEKTNIISFCHYFPSQSCDLSPLPMQKNNEEEEEEKEQNIDDKTLRMIMNALFDGDCCSMRRSAASYLAEHIENNGHLVSDIIKFEPHIIMKFSDLLLKCVDPQIVRSVGCTLYFMILQSDKMKNDALRLNVKSVCKKVYKRWTQPVETRYGKEQKYVIRVIPSLQVAQRMSACIECLE